MAPAVMVQVVPLLFPAQLGRWERAVGISGTQLLVIVVLVMAAIDVGLLAAAAARFQRTRMYLD